MSRTRKKVRIGSSNFTQISYGKDFKGNLLAPYSKTKPHFVKFVEAIEARRERATLINLFNFNQGFLTQTKDIARFDRFSLYEREIIPILGEVMKEKGITAEQVIDELAKVAFSETEKPFKEQGGDLKINSKDKLKALEMLAKFLGLFEKDNAQKAAANQMIQIAFIGNDKKAEIAALNARNDELTKTSIFDNKSLAEKSKELLETKFVNFASPSGDVVGKKPEGVGNGTIKTAKDIKVIKPSKG